MTAEGDKVLVRRTKKDALATRHSLLDAAELLFQAQGVSGTSLAEIAQKAGTTRGAIYWHFKDKADLFNTMLERVTLPLEACVQRVADQAGDPVAEIRRAMTEALSRTVRDARTRRVFEVATLKVEYTAELRAVQQRHLAVRGMCLAQIEQGLRRAAKLKGQRLPVPATVAARGLHALIDGLIYNWMLDTEAFDLVRSGRRALDNYLTGLGFAGGPGRP